MSQLTNIPKQSYFSATLQSPIDSTQTSGIFLSDVPEYTPTGETIYINLLDPGNKETISCTGWNSTTNELSGVTRGVDTYTGEGASGVSHASGIEVVMSNDWNLFNEIATAVNSKADLDSPSFTTDIQVPVYADDAARDAGIPAPANGMMIYNTGQGVFEVYQGGAWTQLSTAASGAATEGTAGTVQLATAAALFAGTDIGGSGASVVAVPSKLAVLAQDNKYIYASTAGVADTYTLTITPAVTAYAAGQVFLAKVHATNTGASTINVSGLGAKSIVKQGGAALEAGDLTLGEVITIGYDGTNFQLLSSGGILISKGDADVLVGGSTTDADTLHTHENLREFIASPTKYKYSFDPRNGLTLANSSFTSSHSHPQWISSGANATAAGLLPGFADQRLLWSDAKDIAMEVGIRVKSGTTGDRRIGFTKALASNLGQVYNNIGNGFVGFGIDNTTLYAVVSDGTTVATTDISAGITVTDFNTYRVEVESGVEARFYVNGTLATTILNATQALPTGVSSVFAGVGTTTTGYYTNVSNIIIEIE